MRVIVLLFLVFTAKKSVSQAPAYTIDNFTVENGLPNNLIEDLEWDKNNILWISTFRGIGRFDGRWVQSFSKENGGLLGDYDGPIIKDPKGDLFFGDIQGDIYSIQNSRPVLKDTQYRKQNVTANPRVLQLPPEFWPLLFTSKNRLFQNQNSNSPVLLNGESFLFVEDHFLLIFDRKTNSYDTLKYFREDISLFKISDHLMLHIKGKGIFRIELQGRRIAALAPVKMEAYAADTEIFWLSAMQDPIAVQGTGCYMLTWNNGSIGRKMLCDVLPPRLPVTSIRYNKELDVLAIATVNKGVYIVRKKYLRTYSASTTGIVSSPQFYYALAEVADQQLMLPFNHQLNLSTDTISRQKLLPDFWVSFELVHNNIYFNDKENNVYSVNRNGNHLRKRLSFGPLPGQTSYINTGNRVFYSVRNMLIELSDEKDSILFTADFDTRDLAMDMVQLKPGYLLLGGTEGIFELDLANKKFELVYKDNNNAFQDIVQYHDYLFAANYKTGLVILKNKKAVKAPMDQLRSLANVHTTYVDSKGYVWFSTDDGILRTKVQALINHFNDTTSYVGYQFFGKKHGMEISELNGGLQRSVAVLRNGNLAYPGINGIITVDRAAVSVEPKKNKLLIDEVTAGDTLVIRQPGAKVFLPKNTRNVKISLLNAGWGIPYKTIEYRLEGHSQFWSTLDYDKQNFIEFQNLNSGEYLLEIRALSVFDRTQLEVQTLAIYIEHPWYKTALFKLFMVIAFTLLVWGISAWRNYYLQVRNQVLQKTVDIQLQEINLQKEKLEAQLEKLERNYAMKNRLISMIGHDIITPLRFMSNAGNKLLQYKDSISKETYNDVIKTMVETGNNLKDMSTNMLNWIKHHSQGASFDPGAVDLYETIQQAVANVAPMAKFRSIAIQNDCEKNVQLVQYAEPIKNMLFQLLSNSIKYCNDCTIHVSSKILDQRLQLFVKDEGPGMTEAQVEHLVGSKRSGTFTSTHENKGHGFGYLIIKDMLVIVKGTMEIQSERGNGTLVILTMPVDVTQE